MENENWPDWRGFMRAHRGGLEPIILGLLKEGPMHGYEVMRTLEERSRGVWRPSAGSVYPILQLMEDQGYVTSSVKEGKKVYVITDSGKAQASTESPSMPWEDRHGHMRFDKIREIMPYVRTIKCAFKQVMHSGSTKDQEAVIQVIKEASEHIDKIAKNGEAKQ